MTDVINEGSEIVSSIEHDSHNMNNQTTLKEDHSFALTQAPAADENNQEEDNVQSPTRMPVQDTAEYQLLTPVRDARVSKTTATKTGVGSSSVAKLRALRGSVA